MNKPVMTRYIEPQNIDDMSVGGTVPVGLLTESHAGWRNKRPIIHQEKCVRCLRCAVFCPEGVIDTSGAVLEIDYTFCKGCGICSYECKAKAISMIKESEWNDC